MSAELTKVVLVGSLGKAMGLSEWHLDVKSPAEAIRAINVNTRGKLALYLSGPARKRSYRIALQKRDNVIEAKEGRNRSGRSTIYIMPTIRGRNNGVGKIIAGVVLLVIAFVTEDYALLGDYSAFVGGVVAGFGVSLVLGGIAQLLTPRAQENGAQPQSSLFPGNSTSVVQGGCIPVVYGHALVSPIPISITVTNNDVGTTAAGTLGDVSNTPLNGGGSQVQPLGN